MSGETGIAVCPHCDAEIPNIGLGSYRLAATAHIVRCRSQGEGDEVDV